MVRSKRKWKKDSPEKLATRIDKSIAKVSEQLKLAKVRSKSPEITSPESKKSKGSEKLPTDSSSGSILDASLIITDSQTPVSGKNEVPLPADIQSKDTGEEMNEPIENNKVPLPTDIQSKDTGEEMNEPTESTETSERTNLEESLKTITQSLATLTKNVLVINNNMVSKSDLTGIKNRLDEHEEKIALNTNNIRGKMTKEEGNTLRKKLIDHDKILKSHGENMEKIEADISKIHENQTTLSKEKGNMSNRIDGLATSFCKTHKDLHTEIEDLKMRMSNQNAEIISLKNGQRVSNTPPGNNVATDFPPQPYETQDPRLNVIIEGLDENQGENLAVKVISLCERIGTKVDPNDMVSVSRMIRKIPLKNRPNPVKVCFVNAKAKERVMRLKYKLKACPDTEHIWLNHDEPTEVRRAKGKARFIASYSRKKGSDAQLTQRGIILDSVFYSYDNLNRIPSIYIPPKTLNIPKHTQDRSTEPMEIPAPNLVNHDADGLPATATPKQQPPIAREHTSQPNVSATRERIPSSPKTPRTKREQKMRLTNSGLVYSGPTAILSHLYKVKFVVNNTPYNSVEQRLMSQKAVLANDKQAEDDIMGLHNTWEIKARGERVKVTKEYLDNRLPIAGEANDAKFQQNTDLMEFLLETENLTLIEGATSAFWAGGEPYNSIAYDNDEVYGRNNQGRLVMDTRKKERNRRALLVT